MREKFEDIISLWCYICLLPFDILIRLFSKGNNDVF